MLDGSYIYYIDCTMVKAFSTPIPILLDANEVASQKLSGGADWPRAQVGGECHWAGKRRRRLSVLHK